MKNFNVQLSQNFYLSDFVNSHHAEVNHINAQYLVTFDVVNHLRDLCLFLLQPVRNHFGVVHINSGYRCRALNKAIAGAQNSHHLYGMAADFWVKDLNGAFEYLKSKSFTQLIKYSSFIHLSYEETNLKRQVILK